MPTSLRRAALLSAFIFCLAGSPAGAQDPNDEPSLGGDPPIELGGGHEGEGGANSGEGSGDRGATNGARLADTGAEPALIALLGSGLLLAGGGLRLRLAAPRRAL